MRYYWRGDTLFIRGSFRAAGSGPGGGFGEVSSLIIHAMRGGMTRNPEKVLENKITREGLPKDFFGLVSGIGLNSLCVLQYDSITVFIMGGVPDGITVIACSSEGMEDGALIGAVITITEAKITALHAAGCEISGTPADVVFVASEGEPVSSSAGPATEPGRRIREAVLFGVPEALKRASGIEKRESPSFFVFSRYGGDHWVEWKAEQCPYYPCHFEGQRCDFCYCPFYPCGDESLGHQVVSSSRNSTVWNCADCTLLHEPEVADYLLKHPEAPLRELKALRKRRVEKGA
jgi:adenosylcobinamide hydrolase